MRITALLAALLPFSAFAETAAVPELYNVTGVQANDVLNIRSTPSASGDIMGALAPDARNVEVVAWSDNGSWAKVNAGESSGWVSARYLGGAANSWRSGALPPTLSCQGTEPFWTLTFDGGAAQMVTPESKWPAQPITQVSDRGFEGDRLRGIRAGDMTVVIYPQACSDGMSDRAFGLSTVVMSQSSETRMLTGCCTLVR